MKIGKRCAVVTVAVFALLWLPISASFARGPWVTLQGGQYLIKRPNDGDSFHISVGGTEYIFRLYFVDAPETDAEFRDRVEEQAGYFHVSVDQVLQVGELAKDYTRGKLTQPFIVRTCWEDAMGRSRLPRYFAFVQTKDGDLGEQLVENGLARAQESAAKPEGLTDAAKEWRRIQTLEKKAQKELIGGWGINSGRMNARAAEPESAKGIDPFEAFFRPQATGPTPSPEMRVQTHQNGAATSASDIPPAPNPQKDIIATKLDVNTASAAELENVHGVGPVMAERIIAARPFTSADDLRKVKGIGDKKFEEIRPFFQ